MLSSEDNHAMRPRCIAICTSFPKLLAEYMYLHVIELGPVSQGLILPSWPRKHPQMQKVLRSPGPFGC